MFSSVEHAYACLPHPALAGVFVCPASVSSPPDGEVRPQLVCAICQGGARPDLGAEMIGALL